MHRHLWRIVLLVLALAFLAQVALPRQAWAETKVYHWDSIDVDIAILPNGDMEVVETHRYVFTRGSFTFAYREIPLDRVEAIDNVWVEEDGRRYSENEVQVQLQERVVGITWYYPRTSNAARAFSIHYVVRGGLRIYEQGDQLWWKAITGERDFHVNQTRVTVRLPAPVAESDLKIAAYGAQAEYGVMDPQTVRFHTGYLPAGTGLEVRVQFPHGLVQAARPAWQEADDRQRAYDENVRPLATLLTLVFSGLVFVAGALAILLWWYLRGRDRPVGLVAEYYSEPPSDLAPGLAGVLVDQKADMPDIIATIVDLARRGIVEMEEVHLPGFLGIGSQRDFTYRLLQEDTQVRPFEAQILRAFFGGLRERRLSELKERFYSALPGIRRAMYDEVVKAGLFPRSPESTRWRYRTLGGLVVALGVGGFFLGDAVLARYADAAVCPGVAVLGVGVVLLVAAALMPRRTPQGAEEAARWRAFRRYLSDVERYTDVAGAQGIFDRYLPYAIAFGLDREWIRKFAAVNAPAPPWYRPYPPVIIGGGRMHRMSGPGTPGPADGTPVIPSLQGMSDGMARSLQGMSESLTAMLNSASSTLSSAPSSSRGGGGWSGGGGRSGGGGGGGRAGAG
jgi:uncharacterized membrane protein YgcG